MRTFTTIAAVTTAATLALATPAEAASRLTLAGTGTSEVGPSSIAVTGQLSGTPVSGAYDGTVTVPGGVPALGECRPAYADLAVGDTGGAHLALHAEGQVCTVLGAWVIHDFRGRFTVSDYSRRAWKNLTGFAEVKAVDGLSDVYATS